MDFHAEIDSYYTLKPDAADLMANHFSKQIEAEKVVVLVAEMDGSTVGYLMADQTSRPPVFKGSTVLMITDICVTKECRRLGIGKAMVEELLRIAGEQGISRIEVGYTARNETSVAFWRKMGFEPFTVKASMELS